MKVPTTTGKPRIIFMGTPEFAVSSLSQLLENGFEVVAVVTAPDKPAGRGMELQQSAVKKFALSKGLTVLQPEKLKDPSFIDKLKNINPDLQVVVAFRMLPEIVWSLPPLGTINVHASLLPHYRGAAPINWAVINGEKETGVTTFLLKHEIDTGDILLTRKVAITDEDNAGTLHDKLKMAGAEILVETVRRMAEGSIQPSPQQTSEHEVRHAPKIFTETCRIDWNKSTEQIHNLIRGLSPYPAAFTELDGKKLKIFSAKKITADPRGVPGQVESDGKNFLRFQTFDGAIEVLDMQLEGRKRMAVSEFLKGYRLEKR
jgi:methionyl-tRNA formyltransferase